MHAIDLFAQDFKSHPTQFTVESIVYGDPLYEAWRGIGQALTERQLSQDEILDIFKRIEQTQTAAGSNRTMLGRGKDWASSIGQQVANILDKIQDSAPVAAVDVAYDQATDAVANMMGGRDGDKSKIMDAIKKYRLLVKAYPKTAGFAKAALVAIAGFATGGAGLPAIAGLTYALDSAIRGDKLSSVLGKGAGAAALAWVGQKVAGMVSADPATAASGDGATPDHSGAAVDPGMTPDHAGVAAPGGGTYTIQKGDQLGYIAQANGNTVKQLMAANPQIDFSKALQPGQQLVLPPSGPVGVGSVWKDYPGGVYGDRVRESFAVTTMPLRDMINRRKTVYRWAVNESQGQTRGSNVMLNYQGVMHILEQTTALHNNLVEYVRKKDVYRPDMPKAPTDDDAASAATKLKRKKSGGKLPGQLSNTPGAIKKREKRRQDREAGITPKTSPAPPSTTPQKPGVIGRGLNWLDQKMQTLGRQLTTKVTAEKLKMNWHQFGKPFDSEQLAKWLTDNQKISPEVVDQVYTQLKLPRQSATAAAAPDTVSGSTRLVPAWNREKGRLMTRAELGAKYAPPSISSPVTGTTGTSNTNQAGPTIKQVAGAQTVRPVSAPTAGTPVAVTQPSWADPKSKDYVGRREVARRMAAQPTATAATTPNYAQAQGYGAVTYKTPGVAAKPAPTWTGRKPAGTAKAKQPTAAERAAYIKAIAPPVTAESLSWSRYWDPSRLLIKQLHH